MDASTYALLADAVLGVHVGFVAFVVIGLLAILAGGIRGWAWVRRPAFRIAHLAAIALVALQAWVGRICPLTILENELRRRAGESVYSGTFVGHWMEALLYYDAPMWVFTTIYTAFGGLVVAAWVFVRPRFGSTGPSGDALAGGLAPGVSRSSEPGNS